MLSVPLSDHLDGNYSLQGAVRIVALHVRRKGDRAEGREAEREEVRQGGREVN